MDTITLNMELYERETQFFGFTPLSFVDDVINLVNEYVNEAIEQLQMFLQQQHQQQPEILEEIEVVCFINSFIFSF